MSRFQDDKFQDKNKDNSNKKNTPISSRFSDSKDLNSTQISNEDSVNPKLIIANTSNNGLQIPEKNGSNSRLITNGNKEDIDNNIISPSAVSLPNKEISNSTTRTKSMMVNLNKGDTSNNVLQANGENSVNPKLIIANTSNSSLTIPEKNGSNSKLKFDNGKDTLKRSDKSKDTPDDIVQEDVGTKKSKSKLIFNLSEKRAKTMENVDFSLAENKRFEPTVRKKSKLNLSFSVQTKDKDVELMQEFVEPNQGEYKTNSKQLYYSQGNNIVGNSRLYERDNASKFKLSTTSKIETSRKLQPSEKSQLAIKLYNKHNTPKPIIPYDVEQLKKYNFNFNLRSKLFSYNKVNFKLRSTRENFKENGQRDNFNLDNQNSKLTIEPKQIKLKRKSAVKVKKTDMSFLKARYKAFLKKQYAKAFRKVTTDNDNTKDTKTSEDMNAIRTKSKQAYSTSKTIVKVAQKLVKVLPIVFKKIATLLVGFISFLLPIIIPAIAIVSIIVIIIAVIVAVIVAVSGVAGESYLADNEDILASDSAFVQFEDNLKEELENVGLNYPGYDQYDFSECDPNDITHDPHELASYLTALLGSYTPETAQPEIEKLFNEMFKVEYKEEIKTTQVPVLDSEGNPLLDGDGNPITEEKTTNTLKVILTTKDLKDVAKDWLTDDQYEHFEEILKNKGHQEDLFDEPSGVELLARSHDISTMIVETNKKPSIVSSHHMITNPQFAKTVTFGEKFIGMKYVFGGSTPETGFDCSGFISYIFNQTGVASFPRTTAQGLYNMSTPIKNGEQQPGDLVFFEGTYNTPNTVTHVGYYVGNGMMLHCGDPIGYVDINSSAYAKSFYAFGRIE